MSRLVGLRAYSRHKGCTLSQVQKSIANGRLEKSVHRKGRQLLIDTQEGDREWEANRDTSKVRDRAAPPPDPALPLLADEVLDLVTVIEERLSAAFRATFANPAARKPESPSAKRWTALYVEWGKIVPALETLQRECRAAVPALRAAS